MGDVERVWLTYEEAGQALGIKPASAKRLSFRQHWPHRSGNNGLARVGVPAAKLPHVTGDTPGVVTGGVAEDITSAITGVATGDKSSPVSGDSAGTDGRAALARVEALAIEVGQLRQQVVDATRGRTTAEAAAADATRRAEEAERTAVEAWRTAADLAQRLATIQAPPAPAAARQAGGLASVRGRGLLGWLLRR